MKPFTEKLIYTLHIKRKKGIKKCWLR